MKHIAINVGAGFVPGTNAVMIGAVRAASCLGWEVVGILDGFDGLLYPDRYPDGGILPLTPQFIEGIDPAGSGMLGQSRWIDPFHVRRVTEDEFVEEVDVSDEILVRLEAENIDALISVVGSRGLSIVFKLHRKGLNTICIPRSLENDIASTMVSFGFNTALSFTIEMLDRNRQAARASRQIAVVEVPGSQTGWLALQAGIAACADAVLIPEISCDLEIVAAELKKKMDSERPSGLVVVAEGTRFVDTELSAEEPSSYRASLSPLATGAASGHVIHRSGQVGKIVAKGLQRRLAEEAYSLTLGPWVRGGTPTAVDRQLGLGYGAGAVQALAAGEKGVMVTFNPPDIESIPLVQSINRIRAVPAGSAIMQIARSIGICLGESS